MNHDRPLASPAAHPVNHLLSSLADGEATELLRALVPVELPAGMRLSEPGHSIESLFFPVSGLISTEATTKSGESTLVSLIGPEGFAGWCGLLDHPQQAHSVYAHTPGRALRLKVGVAREEFARGGQFTRLAHAFMYMQVAQMAQSVLCNRFHSVHARLARWLLEMLARTEEDQLLATHEMLAQMLGSRRSSVTVAATQMQDSGLILYRRGKIRVLNESGLEAAACECYAMVREAYRRMMGEFPSVSRTSAADARSAATAGAVPRDHAGAERP